MGKYMQSDSLMELELSSERSKLRHYHGDIELLYVIEGRIELSVDGSRFLMDSGDMIIINVNRIHSYESQHDVLLGRFLISYRQVKELLQKEQVLFWCNSTQEDSDGYNEIRKIINKILNQSISGKQGNILQIGLYYQLLHELTEHFLLPEGERRFEVANSRKDDRLEVIFAYIRSNYEHEIRLSDLAEYLHLSPAYVSKYIKSRCDVNFVELLNSARLGRAVERLIHTDNSIMKIAMDNGFSSVTAFNKVFKEAYHVTPSEFRKRVVKRADIENRKSREEKKKLQERLLGYLTNSRQNELKNTGERTISFSADAEVISSDWQKPFQMINIGSALDLINSEYQNQILAMQKRMGFRYVRFWDIYAPEMYLNVNAGSGNINFGRLDQIFDFLIGNNLKPYIELGCKPIRLLKNVNSVVKEIPRDPEFENDDKFESFFHALIKHLVKRYPVEEIQTWYFEYQEGERLNYINLEFMYEPMSEKGHNSYFERFDRLAGAIKEAVPEAMVGGGGFPLQHYGEEGMAKILKQWKEHSYLPDFISITAFPYQIQKESNRFYEKRITDIQFVSKNLECLKKAIAVTQFPKTEIHVSEYSLTLSNRNVINDNCFNGAFLVKNAMDCIGKADMMGHWLYTDLYAAFQDTKDLLFGGCGLLSKDGIPKPAFYAFQFINSLYRELIYRESNCIVTANGRNAYRILCHNMKSLNYNYYNTQEDYIYVNNLPGMVEEHDPLILHLAIENMKNGVYLIKQNHINHEYGSIQDEWKDLDMEAELNVAEIDYLQKITTPKLTMREVIVSQNRMQLDIVLKPNEIQWLIVMLH